MQLLTGYVVSSASWTKTVSCYAYCIWPTVPNRIDFDMHKLNWNSLNWKTLKILLKCTHIVNVIGSIRNVTQAASVPSAQSVLNLFVVCSFGIHVFIIRWNGFSSTAACLQMSFHVMLPVKWFAAQGARVTADFRMSWVGMRTQVCLVKETSPTDVAEVLICARVQPLVFYVAGIREQRLPAGFTRLVRSQFRLGARWHVRRKCLHRGHVESFTTDARQSVSGNHVCRGRHEHAIHWVRVITWFVVYSTFSEVKRPWDQVQWFAHRC